MQRLLDRRNILHTNYNYSISAYKWNRMTRKYYQGKKWEQVQTVSYIYIYDLTDLDRIVVLLN